MCDPIVLSPAPDSVAAARRWSRGCADEVGASSLADTAALLVSELVSNVVLHARTSCELSMAVAGSRLRVEVRDGCDRMPAGTIQTDPLAQSGRGMVLIDAMAEASGAAALPQGGKLVWFELELDALPTS